eukprot:570721-Rhodomonas_salina.3
MGGVRKRRGRRGGSDWAGCGRLRRLEGLTRGVSVQNARTGAGEAAGSQAPRRQLCPGLLPLSWFRGVVWRPKLGACALLRVVSRVSARTRAVGMAELWGLSKRRVAACSRPCARNAGCRGMPECVMRVAGIAGAAGESESEK